MPRKKPAEMNRPICRVLIVDDHPAVRDALALRIAEELDLKVCGEAADYAEAIRVAAETHPTIAVIDIGLKSGSGIDLIKRLKEKQAGLLMVVWSMYSEKLYAERALRAGARGYINKQEATGKIVDAIRTVLDGKIYLSSEMTEKLLLEHVGPIGKEPSHLPAEVLSNRELDVFRLIGQGLATAEIAEQLHLSVKTVETYRDRIRQKLDLKGGAEMAHFATRWVLESGA
jgi:DNA-binding NarL/FixJ family response regulator